ncbi:hypothetical protein H4R33_002520, partial [Dimargaris cristalligena]
METITVLVNWAIAGLVLVVGGRLALVTVTTYFQSTAKPAAGSAWSSYTESADHPPPSATVGNENQELAPFIDRDAMNDRHNEICLTQSELDMYRNVLYQRCEEVEYYRIKAENYQTKLGISQIEAEKHRIESGNYQVELANCQTELGNCQTELGNCQTELGNCQMECEHIWMEKEYYRVENVYLKMCPAEDNAVVPNCTQSYNT